MFSRKESSDTRSEIPLSEPSPNALQLQSSNICKRPLDASNVKGKNSALPSPKRSKLFVSTDHRSQSPPRVGYQSPYAFPQQSSTVSKPHVSLSPHSAKLSQSGTFASLASGALNISSAVFLPVASQSASEVLNDVKRSSFWVVQGIYSITGVETEAHLDTSGFSLKIFHDDTGDCSQLFARFCFDELEGIMRLCPKASTSKSDQILLRSDFEKACNFPKHVRPGPEMRLWHMRWRARDGGMRLGQRVGGKPDVNMEFHFEVDETCSCPNNVGLMVSFVMIYGDKVYVFKGKKTGGLEEEPGTRAEQKASWDALWDPKWEDDSDPESSSVDENDYYGKMLKERRKNYKKKREVKHRIIVRPAPRKRVVAKSIPGGRGFNKFIELQPPWALNLSGFWKLDAKRLAEHFGADKDEMELNFTMANNPLHTKVGRQLWATFRFGAEVYGVMRFCPAPMSAEDRKTPLPLKEFEKACVLETGCWPGAPPEGCNLWNFRWRGVINGEEKSGHKVDGRMGFGTDQNGKGVMKGFFDFKYTKIPWTAQKILNMSPPKGNAPTINKIWDEALPESQRILPRSQWAYVPIGMASDTDSEA